jgi:uncharacterized protein (TIGR00251 family)
MSDVTDLYEVQDGAVVLHVQASPGAGRSAVTGRHGHAVKIRVAAPPVDDRANAALVEFLATEFGLKPADVTLVSGATAAAKQFKLGGLDPDAAEAAVERLLTATGTGGQRRSGRR